MALLLTISVLTLGFLKIWAEWPDLDEVEKEAKYRTAKYEASKLTLALPFILLTDDVDAFLNLLKETGFTWEGGKINSVYTLSGRLTSLRAVFLTNFRPPKAWEQWGGERETFCHEYKMGDNPAIKLLKKEKTGEGLFKHVAVFTFSYQLGVTPPLDSFKKEALPSDTSESSKMSISPRQRGLMVSPLSPLSRERDRFLDYVAHERSILHFKERADRFHKRFKEMVLMEGLTLGGVFPSFYPQPKCGHRGRWIEVAGNMSGTKTIKYERRLGGPWVYSQ